MTMHSRVRGAASPRWLAEIRIEQLWFLIVAVVALALVGAAMAPSRLALLVALLVVLVPLCLLRSTLLLPTLLIVLPFFTLMRRLFLLRDPTILNLDPLILLPDLLTLLVVVHLGVAFVRGGDPLRWREHGNRNRRWSSVALVDGTVLLLVALVALGLVAGLSNGVAPALNGARMFGLYLFVYFYARAMVRRWGQVVQVFAITVFTGLVTGLYGVYQTLVGLPVYDRIYFENSAARVHVIGEFVRAFSTFQFTSHFSVFMLCAFFCALTLLEQPCGRQVRAVSLVALLAAVAGIATTFVRSTWVALAAGLVAYGLLRWVHSPLLRWALVAVLLPAGYCAFGFLAAADPVLSPVSDDPTQVLRARAYSLFAATPDTDLYGRYLGFQEALRIAARSPLGYGLGATSAERFGVGTTAWTGDSQVTTLLVELGWPGLICFFCVLLLAMRCNLHGIDRAACREVRTLLVGIAAIQVSLFVASLTGGPLWYTQPVCVYGWLLAGVAVNAGAPSGSLRSSLGVRRNGGRQLVWQVASPVVTPHAARRTPAQHPKGAL